MKTAHHPVYLQYLLDVPSELFHFIYGVNTEVILVVWIHGAVGSRASEGSLTCFLHEAPTASVTC